MSSPGVIFNLPCGKGVTELQDFANLRLSSFAESPDKMQPKNFDVSPNAWGWRCCRVRVKVVGVRGVGLTGASIFKMSGSYP